MVERLMEEPEDALHFEDKTLIQVITDCHATRTATRSQQKHQGALPVVVKVTNALRFFFFFKVKYLLFPSSAAAWQHT